ncbi:sporulation membrane protein YtrI [Lentibacillus jeotgali]|uniref:sporulation membrane protein YtrI n=1 Tax=Lentibacillus jeotgali TaxID=558169 RepID=UPI000262809F|nr:sporulation membrane protein YtrI [Lentibacillus jeotgali]
MHIPPYFKKKAFQRFLAGAFAGAVVAYLMFVYMHGSMYGQLLEENRDLKSEVTELENQNEALLEDNENLDEKSKEPVKVETIEITIINEEDLPDSLIIHDLEELIKEEIVHIVGKDVSIISESDGLLRATIENKDFTVDDFAYQFTVDTLIIHNTVKIAVEAEVAE